MTRQSLIERNNALRLAEYLRAIVQSRGFLTQPVMGNFVELPDAGRATLNAAIAELEAYATDTEPTTGFLYSSRAAMDRAGAPSSGPNGEPVSDAWRAKWCAERLEQIHGRVLIELRNALNLPVGDHSPWISLLGKVHNLAHRTQGAADPDDLTAQLRRALGISGHITWEEAIREVYARTAVSRKDWISGWGQVMQQGHATFYGEVRTELCGGVPMVYVTLPDVEETPTRCALPEQEVFFPLATLYRFTPSSRATVLEIRRAAAEWKPRPAPVDPDAGGPPDAEPDVWVSMRPSRMTTTSPSDTR